MVWAIHNLRREAGGSGKSQMSMLQDTIIHPQNFVYEICE